MNTILYLDQNYVSHLTKARLGVKVNLVACHDNLYDALRDDVKQADRAIAGYRYRGEGIRSLG